MYRKLLIPTDGSTLADIAAKAGVTFAQEIGAAVVGFSVGAIYRYPLDFSGHTYPWPSEHEYSDMMDNVLDRQLGVVRNGAQAANIRFQPASVLSDAPAEEIVDAARRYQCDLIFMGSHSRSGVSRLFLGSVAAKVLALTHIPVTIYHASPDEIARFENEPKSR